MEGKSAFAQLGVSSQINGDVAPYVLKYSGPLTPASVDAIPTAAVFSRPDHKHITKPQFVPTPLWQWLPYQSSTTAASPSTIGLYTLAPPCVGLP